MLNRIKSKPSVHSGTLLLFFLFSFLLFSCSITDDTKMDESSLSSDISSVKMEVDNFLKQSIEESGKPFDWNEAPIEIIFKALQVTDNYLTIGYNSAIDNHENIRSSLLNLLVESENRPEQELFIAQEPRINTLQVSVTKMETLKQLKASSLVEFIELPAYPLYLDEIKAHLASLKTSSIGSIARNQVLDPFSSTTKYINQIAAYSDELHNIALKHKVDQVYNEYEVFGSGIGIAILDNGVAIPEQNFLFENGYGNREMLGHYNPTWFLPWTQPDGSIPRNSDFLGLSLSTGSITHGWEQNERVVVLAPNANQISVRASTFIAIIFPGQTVGITNSILNMADNDRIKVTSMAMATVFRIHQIENALDYYLEKDKIFVAAAGTTLPVIRDIIGVMFPGTYEPIITTSSIENREDNNGQFVAGEQSHTGPEVDFCIEGLSQTSGATTSLASLITLVWSANPTLSADEIYNILKESSHYYLNGSVRDEAFGWGTPDIQLAVESALE